MTLKKFCWCYILLNSFLKIPRETENCKVKKYTFAKFL